METLPIAIEGPLTERGLIYPDGDPIEYPIWTKQFKSLKQVGKSNLAWVGDCYVYGETHYGEAASQALDDSDYDRTTVKDAARVVTRVPMRIRAEGTEFYHWRKVAPLETEQERASFLDAAAEHGLSVRELGEQVKEYQRELKRKELESLLPDSGPYNMVAVDMTEDVWSSGGLDLLNFIPLTTDAHVYVKVATQDIPLGLRVLSSMDAIYEQAWMARPERNRDSLVLCGVCGKETESENTHGSEVGDPMHQLNNMALKKNALWCRIWDQKTVGDLYEESGWRIWSPPSDEE
jgi:hypothetical protein